MTFVKAENQKRKIEIIVFISGMTKRSLKTVKIVKQFFDKYLEDYEMKILDVYQEKMNEKQETLPVAPLLIGDFPREMNDLLRSNLQKEDIYLPIINVRFIPVEEWKGIQDEENSSNSN